MEHPFHITDVTPEDFDKIRKLFSTLNVQYFGESKRKASTPEEFFKSYVTHRIMVQRSKEDSTVIGYAEISNAPHIPALLEDCWPNWLKRHYCHRLPLKRSNTLFFNTFVYIKEFSSDLTRQILCEIFYRENRVRYMIVAQCPDYGYKNEKDCPNYQYLEEFSTVFYPNCFSAISCPNTQQIHVIYRDNVMPKMRYRLALPEDNDDIVEMIDKEWPDLKEQLGEYYIAEELLSEKSNSVLVVSEISHLTAGFIWLTGNVDITTLVENYDLSAFGNLIKFNPDQPFKEKTFYVMNPTRSPTTNLFTTTQIKSIVQDLGTQEKQSSGIISDDSPDKEDLRKINKRLMFFKKLTWLVEKLKSHNYYLQLNKQCYRVPYNISEDELESHSNVFVIQMFSLMASHDLRRLFCYLNTAFGAFPDKDYCLLSISVDQTMTPALYEILQYFIRIAPRPDCSIEEHLYITHRAAIYGDLTLYPVQQNDLEDIRKLLNCTPDTTTLETDQSQYDLQVVMGILENMFEDPFSTYKCFIIKCGDSTKAREDNVSVGFVILRPFTSSLPLKKHFLLPPSQESPTLNQAEIIILKLHAIFHYQADVIFRELATLANCWHFYHFQPTLYNYLSNDLRTSMQPLEPRRIKNVWFDKPNACRLLSPLGPDPSIHPIDLLHDHFAAYQHNLCQSVYYGHAMNIVIIGFSDICKAFLRLILFSWNEMRNVSATSNCLPHVNITVICSPGVMEAEYENSFRCDMCERDEDCWVNYRNCDAFVRDVTERMDVRNWVRFVSGEVKEIDTNNHLVKLTTNCEIHYETLLLLCHTDYGIPKGMLDHTSTLPGNYVQINNRFDKILFYHRLKIFQQEFTAPANDPKSFVIYGSHIRAFEFINFLIKHGVKGNSIHLVMPHQLVHLQMGLMLNDSSIDTRIEEILREMVEDMGVQVYERLNLWEITRADGDDHIVESVTFQRFRSDETFTLKCDFFVSYGEKYLVDAMLEVMEKAGLKSKGNYILVNENYETSEPCIYAMGNFIQHHSEPNHQYRFVSPREAAEKIISVLKLNTAKDSVVDEKYSQSVYFQAHLPMDHYFYKVTIPKRYLANHLDNEYGFPLVTYADNDFCRVRLNGLGMVEEIVAVTKTAKDYDFLKFFCGRHELLLNNLKSRWYLRDIENFLDFFQEPWTELIMNDNFEELQKLNKQLILPAAKKVMELHENRETRRKIMRSYCQDLGINSELEMAFLQFVRKHRSEFYSDIALPEDFPQKKEVLLPHN